MFTTAYVLECIAKLISLYGHFLSEQAFLVTVRNKKRVGYTYELTLKIKGNFVKSKMVSLSS